MDSSIVTALAALLGSLIGGFTSFATTWLSQRQSSKIQWVRDEVSKREALYSDFIDEAAQRLVDAVENNINDRAQIVRFYALFNRIRLVSSGEVTQQAEKVMDFTIALYNAPNVTLRDIFAPDAKPDDEDPRLQRRLPRGAGKPEARLHLIRHRSSVSSPVYGGGAAEGGGGGMPNQISSPLSSMIFGGSTRKSL